MERSRISPRAIALLTSAVLFLGLVSPARGDEKLLASISKIVTREAQKQLTAKKFKFTGGPLEGQIEAIDPAERLAVEVTDFKLGNDLLTAAVTASGRFRVEGKINGEADVTTTFDVKSSIVVEARFIKEGDKYYIDPKINDIHIDLTIIDVSPDNLSGGEQFLSNLGMAAFEKNKEKIMAEINKKIGKRPF